MNEQGLAHFGNALYGFRWRLGLPQYPLKRIMLEKRTVAECVDLLGRHRTCSAHNYVMCDSQGGVADVEVRPEGTSVFEDGHPDWRVHANHYVTPDFARYEDNALPDSCDRLDRMRLLIRERWGDVTADTMKAILADHEGYPGGICRHGAANMHSVSGYVAEPSEGVLHVRRGHGCLGTWTAYEV